MRKRKGSSRAKQRQELLRELAADEVVCVTFGNHRSRAAEAADALKRIQDGTYGICCDCGGKIPTARLHAKPEATRCIDCQVKHEEAASNRRFSRAG